MVLQLNHMSDLTKHVNLRQARLPKGPKQPRLHSAAAVAVTADETLRRAAAAKWVSEHRGLCTQIAQRLGVTPQFVHQVLRGVRASHDGKVETMLKRAGAPR